MYKLLLVSDREDVLEAYDQVHNWGYNGFSRPHIRRDLEGAKEALQKHHVDGIGIALDPEAEDQVIAYLRQEYPLLPIFETAANPADALAHLGGLKTLLNRLRSDFSSDTFDEQQMMIRSRRHFFRKLVSGPKMTSQEVRREMRLLRSRMDPDKTCILMELQQTALEEDRLVGRWQDSDHLLERELFQSFGGDVKGFHVLPLVTEEGKVIVLAGALRDQAQEEDMTTALDECVREGIQHAEEYRGLHLRVTNVQVLPSLYALCSDYAG